MAISFSDYGEGLRLMTPSDQRLPANSVSPVSFPVGLAASSSRPSSKACGSEHSDTAAARAGRSRNNLHRCIESQCKKQASIHVAGKLGLSNCVFSGLDSASQLCEIPPWRWMYSSSPRSMTISTLHYRILFPDDRSRKPFPRHFERELLKLIAPSY